MRYHIDLHMHSCLSPCGDNDMTPNNIVNMALIKQLDIIAVTDHNSSLNLEAIIECAKETNLLVIPGMEIETSEEVHFVALFRDLNSCKKMSDIIMQTLTPIKNNVDIFGEQRILNSEDEQIGFVEQCLVVSSKLSIYDIMPKVKELGGVLIPAHVDKTSYSIISNLGYIPDDLEFKTVELSKNIDNDTALNKYPYLQKYKLIHSSDAHYLWDIAERGLCSIELEEKSIDCLLDKL